MMMRVSLISKPLATTGRIVSCPYELSDGTNGLPANRGHCRLIEAGSPPYHESRGCSARLCFGGNSFIAAIHAESVDRVHIV